MLNEPRGVLATCSNIQKMQHEHRDMKGVLKERQKSDSYMLVSPRLNAYIDKLMHVADICSLVFVRS